jgi:hypothetical protein
MWMEVPIMTRRLALLGIVMALPASSALAQGNKDVSIEGAWRVVETTQPGVDGAYAKHYQLGVYIFTKKHYAVLMTPGSRPDLADEKSASAQQLRAVWGPVEAHTGSYSISPGRLILSPLVAKNPRTMKMKVILTYTLSEGLLSVVSNSGLVTKLARLE